MEETEYSLDLIGERGPRNAGEYTDRAGAEILKARIEAYWRERGHEIQVTLVQAAFTAAVRAARYDVRSEFTNGLPRAMKPKPRRNPET